jgi:hypothetical protein
MSSTILVIGTVLISNPEKVKQAIQVVKDTAEDASDLLSDFGSEVVGVFKDFQDYFRNPSRIPANAVVMIYNNPDGSGANRGLNLGDEIGDFHDMNYKEPGFWGGWHPWNDKVSAIKVVNGVAAAFYEHGGFGGNRLLVIGPSSLSLPQLGWTDVISSCKILPADKVLDLWP